MLKTSKMQLDGLDGMIGEQRGQVSLLPCEPITVEEGEDEACLLIIETTPDNSASIRITESQLRDIADTVEFGKTKILFTE